MPPHTYQRCRLCGKTCTRSCAKCKVAYYCCLEHQRDDWRNYHKRICCRERSKHYCFSDYCDIFVMLGDADGKWSKHLARAEPKLDLYFRDIKLGSVVITCLQYGSLGALKTLVCVYNLDIKTPWMKYRQVYTTVLELLLEKYTQAGVEKLEWLLSTYPASGHVLATNSNFIINDIFMSESFDAFFKLLVFHGLRAGQWKDWHGFVPRICNWNTERERRRRMILHVAAMQTAVKGQKDGWRPHIHAVYPRKCRIALRTLGLLAKISL